MMPTMIELELQATGHRRRMRMVGGELIGPCPKCSAPYDSFTVRKIGKAEKWCCTACKGEGKDLVSFKTWNNAKPEPEPIILPKTEPTNGKNGHAEAKAEPEAKPQPKPKAKPKKEEPTNLIYLHEQIEKLCKMPKGIERAIEKGRIAGESRVTRRDIDDEVERRNGEEELEVLCEHWNVEPWPEPVDADALVRDITWRIGKHVVCSYENTLAVTLWCMFAWLHDAATHSPILLVTSAEPECGKTTLLGIVSMLAPRAISTVEISEAALYRTIEKFKPSFVIDEFDTVLKAGAGDTNKRELRGVINSGHTRGQGVVRINKDTLQPEMFSTFSPKAVGMIDLKLPPATLSRSIVIQLRRRKDDEKQEAFKHKDDQELRDLRSKLMRWSTDNIEAIRSAEVTFPKGFSNRRADNWRMLFAIADLAGEDITDQAHDAAAKIEGSVDAGSIRTILLGHIKMVFDPKDDDGLEMERLERIGSDKLAGSLAEIEGAPWAEWGKSNKPITQHQLAKLLQPLHIYPKGLRLPDGSRLRGYDRLQFQDAWDRYLPLTGGVQTVTS